MPPGRARRRYGLWKHDNVAGGFVCAGHWNDDPGLVEAIAAAMDRWSRRLPICCEAMAIDMTIGAYYDPISLSLAQSGRPQAWQDLPLFLAAAMLISFQRRDIGFFGDINTSFHRPCSG